MADSKLEMEALLAEYREMYEYARHEDRIGATKEQVYGALAFTIFAYSNINFSEVKFLIIASFYSIFIWLYHVFSVEKMGQYYTARFNRVREIEKRINLLCESDAMVYQNTYSDRIEGITEKIKSKIKEKGYSIFLNPFILMEYASVKYSIRPVRMHVTYFLILIWTASIIAHYVDSEAKAMAQKTETSSTKKAAPPKTPSAMSSGRIK